jgi:hypothetical protein
MSTDRDREREGGSRDVDAGGVRNEEGRGVNSGDDGMVENGSKQGEPSWDDCFSAKRSHTIGT